MDYDSAVRLIRQLEDQALRDLHQRELLQESSRRLRSSLSRRLIAQAQELMEPSSQQDMASPTTDFRSVAEEESTPATTQESWPHHLLGIKIGLAALGFSSP